MSHIVAYVGYNRARGGGGNRGVVEICESCMLEMYEE